MGVISPSLLSSTLAAPEQDVLANLFKLQIGAAKHWNVYTHSFLYFGLESARLRMFSNLAAAANEAARNDMPATSTTTNPS